MAMEQGEGGMEGAISRSDDIRPAIESNHDSEKESSQTPEARFASSSEDEKRIRQRILSLLYLRRLHQPDSPGVAVKDLETLLACRREPLAFSLWYLRSKSLVATAGNGLYEITAEGVSLADGTEV